MIQLWIFTFAFSIVLRPSLFNASSPLLRAPLLLAPLRAPPGFPRGLARLALGLLARAFAPDLLAEQLDARAVQW